MTYHKGMGFDMKPISDPEDQRLLSVHAKRIASRGIDQLLGICELSLQDGCIDQDEAEAILTWLSNHRECLDKWPANVLYDRLRCTLSDNRLDDDEQKDLLDLVMSISRPRADSGVIVPSRLPLNDPVPEIVVAERCFCFTGVFDFGSRAECIKAIAARGGVADKGITRKLHYLVIGNIGSEVWRHTSFGAKIVKAVEYRDAGCPLAIISENSWAASIA